MGNKKAAMNKKKNQRTSKQKDSTQPKAKEMMNKSGKSGVASKARGMKQSSKGENEENSKTPGGNQKGGDKR